MQDFQNRQKLKSCSFSEQRLKEAHENNIGSQLLRCVCYVEVGFCCNECRVLDRRLRLPIWPFWHWKRSIGNLSIISWVLHSCLPSVSLLLLAKLAMQDSQQYDNMPVIMMPRASPIYSQAWAHAKNILITSQRVFGKQTMHSTHPRRHGSEWTGWLICWGSGSPARRESEIIGITTVANNDWIGLLSCPRGFEILGMLVAAGY